MSEDNLYIINLAHTPSQRINSYFSCLMRNATTIENWETRLIHSIRLIEAKEGYSKLEIKITDEMCNSLGILHGGCASTLLDILTSTALFTVAHEGYMDGHTVTRTL